MINNQKSNLVLSVVFILVIVLFNPNMFPQNLPENINNTIYEFLERLNIKKIILLPSETRPFSQSLIKEKLIEIGEKRADLTEIENKLLDHYMEFYGLKESKNSFLFNFTEGDFNMFLTPAFEYNYEMLNSLSGFSRGVGIRINNSYGKSFAGYIQYELKGEFGDFVDGRKFLTPKRGYETVDAPNGREFSEVVTCISYSWDWGSLLLAKDYNLWGHGKYGQLILSPKVNAYPFVKFSYSPAKWFRFNYLFAWLNSQAIDSNYYYNSYPGSLINEKRYNFINKFLVANMFTFQPLDYLVVSFGNTFVYSGNTLRLETLLPYPLFKYLDRDMGKGSTADGNGQMFLDFSFNYFKNVQLYGTWFIDVISIRKTLKGDNIENWFGFTGGVKVVDPIIKDFDITLEYSQVDPWVYEHKDFTTTYKHLGYQLGHWIGQNADLLSIGINYRPIWNLKLGLEYESLRKGGIEDVYYVYVKPYEKDIYFLYPPLRKDKKIKFSAEYEYMHSLFFTFKYQYSDINDEDVSRTPGFWLGAKNFYSVGFKYGIPY